MAQDVYNNTDVQYDSYLEPEIDPFIQQILASTAITSINGITGPTVTFAGGTSGFSYAPGGTTLTLVSPLTAKGDLYTHDATNGTKLAVGTNGFVLSANSGTTTGLEWIANATGTVTSVSVVSANGFAGTVATATTTPAITLTTTINAPVLAGNGTAILAATTTGTGSTAVLQTAPSLGGSVAFLSATLNNRMTITGSETENQLATSGGTDFAVNSAGSLFLRTNGSTVALTIATTQAATFASTVAATIFNASTGFRIANAATSGNYLRGNGTNFVSSAIQSGDVTTALGYTPTDAAVVPSTAPSAGQILVGNAGNTAYAKQTVSGSGATITLASTGVMTISAIANASLTNSSITINGTLVSLGGTRTLTLASADFANQGTTTTVLHGNAAGNPSFAQVSLTADVTGTLPAGNGGTGITSLGTGVATALGVNVGTAGAFVVNGGALGSPSSAGTIPAFTLGGTIAGGGNQLNNIIIGTSTPLAGSFTTLVASTSTKTPIIFPASDSTTAIQVTKADGSTRIMDFDTTNARVGINKTPGAFDLDVNGAVNFASTLAVTGHVTLEGVTSTGATGSGKLVFDTSPTFTTPVLGTPTSGTVTNLTGTASININGTVGATTPTTGSFTRVTAADSGFFPIQLAATANGTLGAASLIGWYRANGTTRKGYIGYSSNDSPIQIWTSEETSATMSVIATSGGVILNNAATSWSAISDEREKVMSEWVPFTGALDKLRTLRTGISRYKVDPEGTRRPFLIAQDVQKILPEAVKEQGGKLTLSYTELIPLIIAAINELGRGKLEANA